MNISTLDTRREMTTAQAEALHSADVAEEMPVLRDHASEPIWKIGDFEPTVRALQRKVWNALESFKVHSAPNKELKESTSTLLALLDRDGPVFVEEAYRSLLRRAPDVSGQQYYRTRLRAGVPKLQILDELLNSEEGRRVECQIPGLRAAVRWQRLARIPIVGNVLASVCKLESVAPLQARVRALHQQLADTSHLFDRHLYRIREDVELLCQMTARRTRRLEVELDDPSDWGSPERSSVATNQKTLRKTHQPVTTQRPVVFQIEYAATASPASVGLNNDTRELAVGFRKVRITEESSGLEICDIDFTVNGNSRNFVLFGFSDNEEWGAWTHGKISAFIAWVQPTTLGTLRVSIEANPFDAAFSEMKCVLTSSVGHRQELVIARGGSDVQAPLVNDGKAELEMFFGGTFQAECKNNVSLSERVPKISIIILNFNKPQLSLLSARSVLAAGISHPYEVIIVDNGSTTENLATLDATDVPVRVHRIPCNRYFGEGNNLGAEAARGEYLVFLNNDAFLAPHTIDALLRAFDADPHCGIAGPVFRYPDGRLQEAGAFIAADGIAEQRGKFGKPLDVAALPEFGEVDYVSAACLMIRAERFSDLGGFNYRYDPAYYEDTDLCFRVRLRGEHVVLARDAVCFHIENATTADKRSATGVVSTVDHNRKVFLSVWGKYLANRSADTLPVALLPPTGVRVGRTRKTARRSGPFTHATYSPYPLVPGGGERYILATTDALSQLGPATFVTPHPFSSLRLDSVMFDLGLPTGGVGATCLNEVATQNLERAVVMGNELYPTVHLPAERSFFHCQFPFPLSADRTPYMRKGLDTLAKFEKVIVNSDFTKQAYERELARFMRSAVVEVVNPPVATKRLLALKRKRKAWILSIGRFTAAGHSKRQDVLIEAMKATSREFRKNWKLILCGTVPNNSVDRAYFKSMQDSVGDDIDVEFVLSPSTSVLDSLLAQSTIYAHACGFGVRHPDEFSKCEHFGITLVEALVAGCQIICYELGGGPEIIARVGAGETFGSIDELASLFEEVSDQKVDPAVRHRASEYFDDSAFYSRMISVVQ
jgi:GT2 family glycosyltransferase/glycosyltransferase involved in cell wall biosynthesis